MVYLVIGGAGFIGSHLVRHLLERGHAVRVLDNISTGKRENLPDKSAGFTFVDGDIRDRCLLNQVMDGVDYVLDRKSVV